MEEQQNQSFGQLIWEARRKKRLSQRDLAAKVGVDYTYLSKLENDHVEPSEKVIRSLAEHLDLNTEELIYLTGRMTQHDTEALEEFVKANYKEMPALFRRVRENPGIDSLVKARDEQIAKLQKENSELKSKVKKLEEQLNLLEPYRFYSKEEIERCADELLKELKHNSKYKFTAQVDSHRILDFLNLTLSSETIVPDNQGLILARIFPLENTIVINDMTPEILGVFANYTIAHQIGHWVLHVHPKGFLKKPKINSKFNQEEKPFLCRCLSNINYDFNNNIEWQASYFASCLLMPRYVLEECRKRWDLTKWQHLYAIKEELGVTISQLVNRLQELNWIFIPQGSKQIYLNKNQC